jgi:flagellar basal body-associated protein FliL
MPANSVVADREDAVPAKSTGSAGLKAWLPLAANILLMPLLAYYTVSFALQPSGKREDSAAAVQGGGRVETPATKGAARQQVTVPLGAKILVNLAGTMGTRYLLANITLVSNSPELKALVDRHDAALRDAAASALSSKTIADLEKPGARSLIRTELISIFNNLLGQGTVTEIYLTDFAVQ